LGLPLPDEYLAEVFRLDPEFQDLDAELETIRKDMGEVAFLGLLFQEHGGFKASPRERIRGRTG